MKRAFIGILFLLATDVQAQKFASSATILDIHQHSASAHVAAKSASVPPYPVLFVHGLNSQDRTWEETIRALQQLGWGEAYSLHADLNVNTASTNLVDDVIYTSAFHYDDVSIPFRLSSNNGTLFLVNFDAIYDPDQDVICKVYPNVKTEIG